ncbi:MAG: ABC transporter ATP-binding protein/permease [Euryarchaeota archaeon]|nr:ABC transporter ATP-binding protein/permease [Euryarchaeota archaeon]
MKKESPSMYAMLRYFIRGFELRAGVALFLAILIGIVEAFNLALLYPMLSTGFGINTDLLPFASVFEALGTILPIGSPFVNFGIVFILMTIVSMLLQFLYWKQSLVFRSGVIVTLKERVFQKIRDSDYRFFVDTKQGDILMLINGGPGSVMGALGIVIAVLVDLTITVTVAIMLISISWQGFILVMIGGGLFFWLTHLIGESVTRQLAKLGLESGQAENRIMNEFVNGAKAITASNSAQAWTSKYQTALQIYWSKFPSSAFIQLIPGILMNSLFYISIGATVLVLYVYTASDFMSIIPVLGTFAVAALRILPKITSFGNQHLALIGTTPLVTKTYELLTSGTYNVQKNGTEEFLRLESDIEVDNITFAYHQALVLKDVSLTIQHRKVTALVGPSGSGKSTLANLLLRLYDPKSGSIIVNKKDLEEYDIGTYRNHIGYVSQDPFVFNASIKENICFGIEYTDEEIVHAAKLAHAHEFIISLPKGYDTIVGDQGLRLSGGEKQRVIIARAMIRRPEILILDEATSSLDNISEQAVQTAIDNISKECTTVIIAHRLSTIHNADRIYVLEYGKVIESGAHGELMKRDGAYAKMYALSQKPPQEEGKE